MRTRRQFDAELSALEAKLILMGRKAGDMLESAIISLIDSDVSVANDVILQDEIVDTYNMELEAECMRLVIQQQPLAHDLRIVGMVYKAIADVERIADHAVDIAKIARDIASADRFERLVDVALLHDKVIRMFRSAMKSFEDHDVDLALRVIADDDEVDDLFMDQRAALLEIMEADALRRTLASHLIFVAQFLERIGDRSVNIAERVHLLERGERPVVTG